VRGTEEFLTFEALVTKLMWALGQSEAISDVKKIMSTNYADEVSFVETNGTYSVTSDD